MFVTANKVLQFKGTRCTFLPVQNVIPGRSVKHTERFIHVLRIKIPQHVISIKLNFKWAEEFVILWIIIPQSAPDIQQVVCLKGVFSDTAQVYDP